MATKKPMKKFRRYDEGGFIDEATAKQRGLDMSNKEEPVGFFERIRAGNIDQPGTEAYNRFGAGRTYAKNMDDENEAMRAANRAPSAPAASSRPLSDDMYSDTGSSTGMGAAGTSETVKPTRQVMTKPTLPASKPTASAAPRLRETGPTRGDLINKPSLNTNYSNEGRGKPAPAAPEKPSMNVPEMRDNAKKALAEDPTALTGIGAGAGAAAAALLARSKLGKMFKGAKTAAEKVAEKSTSKSPYLKEIGTGPSKKLLEGPRTATKSSDVTDVVPKSTSYRSLTGTAREDARADEARKKLMNSNFVKKPKKPLDESDTTGGAIGYKRGGKTKKYASGGMVSSASKRADGIASKGKTRCKIC